MNNCQVFSFIYLFIYWRGSWELSRVMHRSIPAAHSPRGPGICKPRGYSRAFDTHAVSYQNITTQKVLLEKKQIGSSVKDRNKLKRVVKACSRFYACISSLLIKPELHSETRELSTWINVFWLVNQISVDIIWRISFHNNNLCITYNFAAFY